MIPERFRYEEDLLELGVRVAHALDQRDQSWWAIEGMRGPLG